VEQLSARKTSQSNNQSSIATYPHKGTKLGVLEKLGNDFLLKLRRVFHDKGFTVVAPAGDRFVAAINHVIGFCTKESKVRSASR